MQKRFNVPSTPNTGASASSTVRAVRAAILWAGLGVMAHAAMAVPLSVKVTSPDGKAMAEAVVGVLVRGQRSAATDAAVQIVQRDRQFQPAVTAVQTGTSVQFPNLDTVRHQVYSFSPAKRFELRLYAGTPSTPVVFDKAGVAALGCNIHDGMSAWVVVMDTPHIARTDASGVAVLDVPAGQHKVQTWHASQGQSDSFVETDVVMGAAPQRAHVALPAQVRR